MNTKGKFYLKLNIASASPYFWNRDIQNFTTDAQSATFFDTRKDADDERRHAEVNTECEVQVLQATKDI